MAETRITGPLHVTGGDAGVGPSAIYQGTALLDPRYPVDLGLAPVGTAVRAIYDAGNHLVADFAPVAKGAATLVTAATPAAWGALTLKGQASGISPNIPFRTLAGGDLVTSGITLDMGFCRADTTSTSKDLSLQALADLRRFYVGQRLIISGALSANKPLYATVVSLTAAGNGTVTLDTAAGVSLTATNVGTADSLLTHFIPRIHGTVGNVSNTSILDPCAACARNVGVTNANASDDGATLTVSGYDIYGVPMTELITLSNGGSPVMGKKAFKHIISLTTARGGAGATPAGNISVGTGDTFGFAIRADLFEYVDVSWAAAKMTANTGFTAPDYTATATNGTGDVRGTYAVQTSAADASRRLVIFQKVTPWQAMQATASDPSALFGVTQA